jgi:serine/threonine protein kinase
MLVSSPTDPGKMYQIDRAAESSGEVNLYQGRRLPDGLPVLVSLISKAQITTEDRQQQAQREVDAISGVDHPNIVTMLDYFEDGSNYYAIMDFCTNGTLYNYVQDRRKLKEKDAAIVFFQILCALKYCHSRSLFHLNLSLHNIYVTNFPHVKLAAFSHVVFAPYTDYVPRNLTRSAPEQLQTTPYYPSSLCDIWGLGLCLYEMVMGRLPWTASDRTEVTRQIEQVPVSLPESFSEPLREIISSMMNPNPILRISLDNLMYQTWVKTGVPRNRMEAEKLRETTLEGIKLSFRDKPVPKEPEARNPVAAPVQRVLQPPVRRPLASPVRKANRVFSRTLPTYLTPQKGPRPLGTAVSLGQFRRSTQY